ncbi:MAG: cellulose binding domain-containing protein, partial [Verrucomicrobiota bacterium]
MKISTAIIAMLFTAVLCAQGATPITVELQDVTVTFTNANDYGTGFEGHITITNKTQNVLSNWTLTFTMDPTVLAAEVWNARLVSASGNSMTFDATTSDVSYNKDIVAGGSVSFVFQAHPGLGTG